MSGPSDLNTALCAYLGYKAQPFPGANWRAAVEAIGMERAAAIELPMLSVIAELREQRPDWRTQSLVQGSEWAVRQVRARHPELDERSGKALFWLFSYENK